MSATHSEPTDPRSSGDPKKVSLVRRGIGIGSISVFSFFSILCITFVGTEFVGIDPEFSFAAALAIVFYANFWLTRNLVFRERKNKGNAKTQLRKCFLVSISFRIGEYLAFLALYNFLSLPYTLVSSVVLIASFAGKVFIYDRYVFTQ